MGLQLQTVQADAMRIARFDALDTVDIHIENDGLVTHLGCQCHQSCRTTAWTRDHSQLPTRGLAIHNDVFIGDIDGDRHHHTAPFDNSCRENHGGIVNRVAIGILVIVCRRSLPNVVSAAVNMKSTLPLARQLVAVPSPPPLRFARWCKARRG
jgi:hypothetical protein